MSKMNMLTNSDENCGGSMVGETTAAAADKTSVKKLMEEEMLSEQDMKEQISVAEVEPKESNSECGHVKKNRWRMNRTSKRSCDMHVCELNTTENSCHQISERKTSNDLDLEVILEEICHQIHQKHTSFVKHDWHDDLDMQSNQTYSVFEEKLSEAIKVFVNQKFACENHLPEDGKLHPSKEFMDALQTMSSNKELLLKLIKDRNSMLVKRVEDSQLDKDKNPNSVVGTNLVNWELSNSRPSELSNRKKHTFFRRRSKSEERNELNGNENCQPSNRIIILKPGPKAMQNPETDSKLGTSSQSHCSLGNKGQNERIASQFSFTEIKRKLKHAMGKERHGISTDGVTNRFLTKSQKSGKSDKEAGRENGGWGSPNRNHFYNERMARPSIGIKKRDKNDSPKDAEKSIGNQTIGYPEQKVSNIYIEAKKHLLEMLSNGDEVEEFSNRQLPETLGRILSLNEFNFSPICSPGQDKEQGFATAQMRLSSCNNLQMVNENTWRLIQESHVNHQGPSWQNLESESCIIGDIPDDIVQALDSNLEISDELKDANAVVETLSSTRDEMSSRGDVDILKSTDTEFQKVSKVLDVLEESSSITDDDQKGNAVCEEEESSQCLKLDSLDEDESLYSPYRPSSLLVAKEVEDLESAIERPERPSPVSVLEPLFTEDEISPASIKSLPVVAPMQTLDIHFEDPIFPATDQGICVRTCMEDEESEFDYVEAVLLGSGLNWDEFLSRWLSSNHLLDPSLFDEVELFSNRSRHDQELLFDCTDEVLKEVCEYYFGYFPGASFVKRHIQPIPKGKNIILEVWKGVEWHLLLPPPPRTLDQIVRKDMARTGTWMDLRFDSESIGIEVAEAIFEDLIKDVLLTFVDESPKCDFSELPTELKENESTMCS
ncbi:uncharacterized protein LOC132299003 isoform X2 [Cornus florida]|nr:uncharacterized protein LOC132299003 isoform X2 [Cornus florida]